jgi:hypothetical protein
MSFWTSAGSDSRSREAASITTALTASAYTIARARSNSLRTLLFSCGHKPIVCGPAHPRRLVGVLVIGRVAAKPQAQLASAPEGSVKLGLSLGGVGKLISAPRPKVTAANRQVNAPLRRKNESEDHYLTRTKQWLPGERATFEVAQLRRAAKFEEVEED